MYVRTCSFEYQFYNNTICSQLLALLGRTLAFKVAVLEWFMVPFWIMLNLGITVIALWQ